MKSVIVKNLQIQFDLHGDKVTKANVIEALELMNTHLQTLQDFSPQMFINAVDDSDIEIDQSNDADEDFEEFIPLAYKDHFNRPASIWSELRDSFEDEGILHIDAWTSEDENDEDGHTIAKINTRTGEVCYLDERARTDYEADELISGNVEIILNSIKEDLDKTMDKCRDENF